MKTAVLAGLVLASASFAQIVVPTGHAAKDGDSYGYGIGYWNDARVQLAEGDLVGKVMLVKRFGLRLDAGRSYSIYSGQAKTWTNVSINASDVDTNKITNNLAKNVTGKPTLVFNSKYSLPGFTSGRPAKSPMPFDAKYSYQFSKPYLASGKNKILWDFTYKGGKLANAATFHSAYYFDGVRGTVGNSWNTSTETWVPARTTHTCRDSALGNFPSAAITSASIDVHNNLGKPTTPGLEDKSRMTLFSLGTAPGANVIHVVGLSGNTTGFNVGANCNKLYVNLAQFYLLFTQKTSTLATGYSGDTYITIPNKKIFTGLPLWAQSAWTDSKKFQFSLTNATTTKVPAIPAKTPDRAFAYTYTSGTNTYSYAYRYPTAAYLFPVVQYNSK